MAYQIQFLPAASKQLRKLPRMVQERIVQAIVMLTDDPRPHGHRKLAGRSAEHRIRVGDYRIVYTIDDAGGEVMIKIIADRKDVYRGR
jgi:mRNA interferase RelE/StbE